MAEFTEFPLDFPQAEAPKQPETTEKPEKGRQRRAREGAELNRGRIDLTFLLLTLLLFLQLPLAALQTDFAENLLMLLAPLRAAAALIVLLYSMIAAVMDWG